LHLGMSYLISRAQGRTEQQSARQGLEAPQREWAPSDPEADAGSWVERGGR
jgi:hypothetical protein